jgi:hypothetical protein
MGAKSESGSRLSSLCSALHEGERCQDFFVRFTFAHRALIAFRAEARRASGLIFAARAAPPLAAIFLRFDGDKAFARAAPPRRPSILAD